MSDNNTNSSDYLEFQLEDVIDKRVADLTKEPFIIADEDIFHIAEFQVVGAKRIKISVPDFTGGHIEGFFENDFYGSAILYMTSIEVIKDLVRLNSDDIPGSSIHFISSEELNYELIVEAEDFKKVAQIYERIYYSEMYMDQAYQNRVFNDLNLFEFGNIPKGVYHHEYTYLGPEFNDIVMVDKNENQDEPISNWKGTPFRVVLDSDLGNVEISIVENMDGTKSRVYLSYYFRDTDYPYLNGDYDVYDNHLLYESFEFWALIQSIKEYSDNTSFNPKAQLQFGTMDTLDFAVLIEADKIGELDDKINTLIADIDTRRKEIFKEYQNKYSLKNMFK
jgi:hypothetical protein